MKKTLFFLVLVAIIVLSGCKKPETEPSCKITSPLDGAELPVNKDIIVTVKVENLKNISMVTVTIDNVPCDAAITEPYTVTIPALLVTLGKHTIKALAVNNIGKQAETSISVTVIESGGGEDDTESPDFVDFADGKIPASWKTNTWVVDIAVGYEDNYSLRSDNPIAAVLTNKTMSAPGYVEFYTRGNNFDLYIDGVKAHALSYAPSKTDWNKWIYAFDIGKHSFKWENTLSQIVYLDNIRFALATLPEVATYTEVTDISSTSATTGGNITKDGNHIVTARGVCWSTSQNPTLHDSKTEDGTGKGNFTSNLIGLEPNTTYYVRAYASNAVGTAYGEQVTFVTLPLNLPTVITGSITNIKSTSADCVGTVTSDGFSPVTARGVCWSTSQNPTINDNKTKNGSGVGSFTSRMSGLTRNTQYYVRAYATNNVGTSYGEQRTFTPKFSIGENYQGGIIAYLDNTGEHGFIAATTNYSTRLSWNINENYDFIGATGTSIGTGKSNTEKIIQVYGQGNYAAKKCDELIQNGYNDWYLPSKNELNELYKNKDIIGFPSNTDDNYWSSSEYNSNFSWAQSFYDGKQTTGCFKQYKGFVRCIRSF